MEMIEMTSLGNMYGEGSAVRLGADAGQDTSETHVYFDPCEESRTISLADACHNREGAGRILDVNLMLRNVCPGKRTAVGITVHEVDASGQERSRGFHSVTVPAHSGNACCDITLPTVRFILPEDLRTEGESGCSGKRRHFVIRTTNRYVDSSVTC